MSVIRAYLSPPWDHEPAQPWLALLQAGVVTPCISVGLLRMMAQGPWIHCPDGTVEATETFMGYVFVVAAHQPRRVLDMDGVRRMGLSHIPVTFDKRAPIPREDRDLEVEGVPLDGLATGLPWFSRPLGRRFLAEDVALIQSPGFEWDCPHCGPTRAAHGATLLGFRPAFYPLAPGLRPVPWMGGGS